MQAIFQLLRKLVLPSNASSGARIVIDGTQNGIFIYDSSNNLVESIAAASGTDPYGNHYTSGFGSYGIGSQTFGDLSGGNLILGNIIAGTPDVNNAGVLQAVGRLWQLVSSIDPGLPTLTDPVRVTFATGQSGQASGQANTPFVGILANGLNSSADLHLPGSVIATDNSGTLEKWHTPSYGTNWGGNSVFNGITGYRALMFRRTAEDSIKIIGVFLSAAGAVANPVMVFPAGYRPLSGNFPVQAQSWDGTTLRNGTAEVTTGGSLNLFSQTGVPVSSSTQYIVSGEFPLGNVA